MEFKIKDYKKEVDEKGRDIHRYLVESEIGMTIQDLVCKMLPFSRASKHFKLRYSYAQDFFICDMREMDSKRAYIRLRGTLDRRVTRVNIFDSGIGKKMIDKFMRSIENSDIEK